MSQFATAYDTLWDIGAVDIDGQVINQLRDLVYDKKLILVTNVASNSKYADMNYNSLTQLHQKYRDYGFEILAFPCNQFDKHEPLKESEIKQHVIEKYGAEFPMFQKTAVNGKDTDEVFKFLRSTTPGLVDKKNPQMHEGAVGLKIKDIPGDFCKFLVDSSGKVVDCLMSEKEDPMKLEERIRKFLGLSH